MDLSPPSSSSGDVKAITSINQYRYHQQYYSSAFHCRPNYPTPTSSSNTSTASSPMSSQDTQASSSGSGRHSTVHTQTSTYLPDDPQKTFEAQLLAFDYINWRLSQIEYEWLECPELPPPNRVRLAMRTLCETFEKRYDAILKQMITQLNITSNTVYPSFVSLTRELIKDGINWGRIVALFSFGGALAVHCAENGMEERITSIAQWVETFTSLELRSWIEANGGWDGFVAFYESCPPDTGARRWPDMNQMAAAGAIAVVTGAATLARMLSQ